ncbi:uncharacterized protein LAESUDRAFT_728955 [Laetiporus sulphureus 93-53]|uniref:Uncharacterized protein n=1 Tax=Laetiporus sulphureus 93-53 TaxID=1314785 RepID=A0A165CXE3_9APHY|nr:uncharacterized protein LAESUDRAFT_728955 [Laetiporus sulphureus 93-53]KZT03665.1 hypothetical protein LAESUDRAFT_728955 [Laetiporus sulphureus 93-53]
MAPVLRSMTPIVEVVIKIQFKGERAGKMGIQKNGEPPTAQFARELHVDFEDASIPLPESFRTYWQSGQIQCVWLTTKNSKKYCSVLQGFDNYTGDSHKIEANSISWMSVSVDGDCISQFSTSKFPTQSTGKAPRPQTLINAARMSTSVLTRPNRPQPHHTSSSSSLPVKPEPAGSPTCPSPISASSTSTIGQQEPSMQKLFKAVNPRIRVRMGDDTCLSSPFGSISPTLTLLPASNPTPAKGDVPSAPKQMLLHAIHLPRDWNTSSDVRNIPGTREGEVHALTRELWDVRRQITALKAREDFIDQRLKYLGAPALTYGEASKSNSPEHKLKTENDELRTQFEQEASARKALENALQEEQSRRLHAEGIVDDVRRECTAPFVVPSLVDAFMRLSQMTGKVLEGGLGS